MIASTVKTCAALIVCAALGIAVSNIAVTSWRLAHAAIPGRFYTVDGREMYLYCVGDGSPTLIIDSRLSSDSLGWYGVQRSLSALTRTCSYDRSGLGLSEPRTDRRDAETITRQLHTLLRSAGIVSPIVPVGWSAGGLYFLEYAREFPSDLAGMVLIDGSSPQQLDELPGSRASYDSDLRTLPAQFRWEWLRVITGWERLLGRCSNEPSEELRSLPPDEYARLLALYISKTCRPAYVGGEVGELRDFDDSTRQAARLTTLGSLPLAVITHDLRKTQDQSAADRAEDEVWDREQERLAALSAQSWRVIARGSGHAVHHDRPDLVVGEIGQLISYVRGGTPPRFGSTVRR